jgi:hypothetical protein
MNRLNDYLFKAAIMTLIITIESVYVVMLHQYHTLSVYWILLAIMHLTFWVIYFYPKYNWHSFNLFRKVLAAWVLIIFCLYFLPTDILLHDTFSSILKGLNFIGMVSALIDCHKDDDDDDKPPKKAEKKSPKRKWAFLTNQV